MRFFFQFFESTQFENKKDHEPTTVPSLKRLHEVQGPNFTTTENGKLKITKLVGGLRSGMSYCGSKTIPELYKNGEFIRITSSGKAESGPHDVQMID